MKDEEKKFLIPKKTKIKLFPYCCKNNSDTRDFLRSLLMLSGISIMFSGSVVSIVLMKQKLGTLPDNITVTESNPTFNMTSSELDLYQLNEKLTGLIPYMIVIAVVLAIVVLALFLLTCKHGIEAGMCELRQYISIEEDEDQSRFLHK